jgi:hypothetical protein
VTVQEEFKFVLREILAPALHEHGYMGSGNTRVKTSERGDIASINFQSSQDSTGAVMYVYINVGLVPGPWLEFQLDGWPEGTRPKTVNPSFGLYRGRSEPATDRTGRWTITAGRDAVDIANRMVAQLEREEIPTLDHLLNRDEMIRALRRDDNPLGHRLSNRLDGLGVLLADDGPSSELDEVMAKIEATAFGSGSAEHQQRLLRWMQERASR